jgi:hypothetical protein
MLDIFNPLLSCCFVLCLNVCRSVVEPQRDLGAQALPSRTRSPDPRGATQSLVDNARTVTPPPAADERVVTPPRLQIRGRQLHHVVMGWEQ